MLLSYKVLASEDDSDNTGLEQMNIHLNTSALLPSNIPLESVDVRFLPSLDDYIWTYLNEYTKNSDNSFDVTLSQNGVLLIIGNAPAPNASSGPLEFTQLEGGSMQIHWDPTGDIENPYIGSWKYLS